MANPSAQTAYGPMIIVAAEQHLPEGQRLVQDELAGELLPPVYRRIAKLTRWRAFRSLLFRFSERAPGVMGGVLCRKRYIDDRLLESLREGVQAVVNLGAGMDSRACRLRELETLPVFEVDLPENIDFKRERLEQLYGSVPKQVRLVPLDFDRQELMSGLRAQGYRTEWKCFFIWEAVTQYLSAAGVHQTMSSLANAQAGSRLVFTYVCKDFIEGTNRYGLDALYDAYRGKRQWWHFGLEPGQVGAFLEQYSWEEAEQMGREAYTERYLKPIGRKMEVMEIERTVYAVKV
jgi:methyltransferase (TIGR00027 family)